MMHPQGLRRMIAGLFILIAISVIGGLWQVPSAFSAGTITGTVYRDYDASGTRQAAEATIAGITVTAYDAAGVNRGSTLTVRCTGVGTALNAAGVAVAALFCTGPESDPNYSLNAAGTGPYRVEFTGWPSYMQPSAAGAQSGTTVQFVPDGTSNGISLALHNPGQYCQNNPTLLSACYVNGDPLAGGNTGTLPWLVEVPYSGPTSGANVYRAQGAQIGATWGIAYQRATRQGFVAAVMKRHTGFGSGGPGAIYRVDLTAGVPTSSLLVDLNTLGIAGANAGASPRVAGDLSAVATTPNRDPSAFDAVGKLGLGGMDISEDNTTLWVMNLNTRSLIEIRTGVPWTTPTAANVTVHPLPSPACSDGQFRPWAVNFHDGRVYVGGVCSGETETAGVKNNDVTDLVARIYVHDPNGLDGNFTPVHNFALNYPRGYISSNASTNAAWKPWINGWSDIGPLPAGWPTPDNGPFGQTMYPQPIFSDIAFDNDGSIIVGLLDRAGMQLGNNNYSPNAGDVQTYEGTIGGDTLRLCANPAAPTGYSMENNAGCTGSAPTGGAGNGQGPGSGEYYYNDAYTGTHQEVTIGGLTTLPRAGETIVTVFDPDPGGPFRSGGMRWFRNTDAALTRYYLVFGQDEVTGTGAQGRPATFGKAAGLGDVALTCQAAPNEIGNRVWNDADANGIQDPNELPIANVTVQLYQGATLIDTVITDANGNYSFSSDPNRANTTSAHYTLNIQPATAYEVRVSLTQPALAGLLLTPSNADSTVNGDARDSDGALSGTNSVIYLTTGAAGANDHTSDFGFTPPPLYSLGNRVWGDLDNSGTINAADGATPGIAGVTVNLFRDSDNNGTPDGAVIAATVTNANGYYLFTSLSADTYIAEVVTPVGFGSSTPNAGDPDLDLDDSDDNGVIVLAAAVRSDPVTLGPGNVEPTTETDLPTPNPDSNPNNRGDLSVDFGFVELLSLGNFVWYDTNDNGTLDLAEQPISGVTLRLFADTNASGALDAGDLQVGADQTTNASGNYLFTDLEPDNYFVQVLSANFNGVGALVGYSNSSGSFPGDANNNRDHGTPAAGQSVVSELVTLTVNSEPITDGDASASTNLTIDFGFYRLSVGNQLWNDVNNNGTFDGGETPFSGVRVELYDATTTLVAVTTADGSGAYLFNQQTNGAGVGTGAGLAAGDYYVKIPQSQFNTGGPLAGYHSSTGSDVGDAIDNNDNGDPVAGDGVRSAAFTLTPGAEPSVDDANGTTSNPTIDFGFYTMSLGNLVWLDANNNGAFDGSDTPLRDVVVSLYNGLGVLQNPPAITTPNGHYLFTGLAAGDYYVELDAANFAPAGFYPGYTSSTGTIGSATGLFEPAPDPDLNAADSRDNGSRQAGGAIRSGVITLVAGGEPPAAVEIGGNTLADPAPDTNSNLTVDFGLFPPVSLGNRVWIDANNNGAQDGGESNVPDGVTVNLYYDANGNGVLDGGEPTAIRTTPTSGGLYLFDNLVPGAYLVELDAGNFSVGPLAGYTSSTGTNGKVTGPAEVAPDPSDPSDTDDNGTISGTLGSGGSIRSALVTLTAGGEPPSETPDNDPNTPDANENLTVDFGVFLPARLGDRVWFDTDRDGVDTGETGTPNVTVTLYDSTSGLVVDTMITNPSGNYQFTNLVPGNYYVIFSDLPLGHVFTGQDLGGNDTTDSDAVSITGQTGIYLLNAGDSEQSVDAGIYNDTRASLGNYVWYDTDEDGVQNIGGVPGVTVELFDATNALLGTTTTLGSGLYLFDNLLEGDYYVRFTPPAGYVFSPQDVGGNTLASDPLDSDADPATRRTILTHLDPGEDDLTWDAGIYYSTVALGNRVWEDTNNNGAQEAGEPGISAATVRLYDAGNSLVGTTITDPDGFYLFTGLTPGDYTVEVAPIAGYISSSGTNGEAIGPYEGAATPDPDANPTDADDNGTTSAGVVRSQPITLTRGGEPTGEPTALPNPDTATPDFNSNLTVDFGFYRPLSLGNLVWHDANDNGIADAGEQGIPNVAVELFDAANNSVAVATTDINGFYLFTNLASGSYTVEVTTPGGYVSSTDIVSSGAPNNNFDSDDNGVVVAGVIVRSASIALAVGSEPSDDPGLPASNASRNTTLDFGFYQPVSLGNLVWGDLNNNGVFDGESGIDGVTVNLYRDANGNSQIDAGELAATQLTASGGLYLFTNLRPGDYIVELPAGNFAAGGTLEHYASSTGGGSEPAADPDNDTNDNDNGTAQASGAVVTGWVTLTSGGEPINDGDANANSNLTVDFGVYPLASLGDYVWLDTNRDGVQDIGEGGVAGVTVQIYAPGIDNLAGTADDVLVGTTPTGALGDYQFDDLVPGDYFVQFVLPLGYARSPQDSIIATDATDSDADATTGRTVITTLTSNESDPSWDAGIYYTASLGDRVWLDQNANGIQDAGEPGVPGVTVTIYSSGIPVGAPAITDANGNYAFSNLPPGDYSIQFTPPAGYVITPADQGANDAADSDADPSTGATTTTTIALDEHDPTWDAGLYQLVSLGNLVWNDVNNNGLVDGGENGIDAVIVNLYRDTNGNGTIDTGELAATQTTNGGGRYLFTNLVPGSYLVQLDPANFNAGGALAGYHSSTGSIGTNLSAAGPYEPAPGPNNDADDDDNGSAASGQGIVSTPITLTSAGEPTTDGDTDPNSNLTVDFGVLLPASLGSIVWYDTDNDGVLDPSELGVPGVTVTLYDSAGQPIATTITSANGNYQFTDLPPGSYTIGFDNLPPNYTFTPPNQGGNDAVDSDADPATGLTSAITLVPGQNNPSTYAGLVQITPTAIALASFTATREGDQVVVRWVTTAEINTWGFQLYRSADGKRASAVRVTPQFIPGQGRGQGGASYSWTDTAAVAGVTYTYWLVETEIGGATNEYGPATASVRPTEITYRLFMPLAAR